MYVYDCMYVCIVFVLSLSLSLYLARSLPPPLSPASSSVILHRRIHQLVVLSTPPRA
jgi:hypothetical protein